ncbi:NACHT, LRR and PYD domains-containing protein 1 homolog [Onychostoma macrolepis]|uniref:NACHT, LRR and PYD domains-containing protein 1 homolog n=1 Tax=Onychostoma macrolepis TaxID=369639 RepID=UPI00272B5A65|nr:NACHT, LRR and PYD domains-containing protein 1 homolog [Onychostoma macrolepis]
MDLEGHASEVHEGPLEVHETLRLHRISRLHHQGFLINTPVATVQEERCHPARTGGARIDSPTVCYIRITTLNVGIGHCLPLVFQPVSPLLPLGCLMLSVNIVLSSGLLKGLDLPSGCYECSRTGLRIECSRYVRLKYHICDWKCVGVFPEMEHFTPCGPLMDIVVISGELKAVYLPHFLCLGGPPIQDEVRVLHVEDCGLSLEKCTLTRFHGKLLHHSFSPKGLLLRSGFSVNYHCETLIYETQKTYLTLHVYLIPSEKNMIEAVENTEIKSRTRLISKPGTWYSLRTLDENKESKEECNSEVQPKVVTNILKYYKNVAYFP